MGLAIVLLYFSHSGTHADIKSPKARLLDISYCLLKCSVAARMPLESRQRQGRSVESARRMARRARRTHCKVLRRASIVSFCTSKWPGCYQLGRDQAI